VREPTTRKANAQQLASQFSTQTETSKQPSNMKTLHSHTGHQTVNQSGLPATTAQQAANAAMRLPDARHTSIDIACHAGLQKQQHHLAGVGS
jgi:cell division septum initiation protein DivIVA